MLPATTKQRLPLWAQRLETLTAQTGTPAATERQRDPDRELIVADIAGTAAQAAAQG